MSDIVLEICHDADALAARGGEIVTAAAREAIRQRGRFTFVLAGGSTPEKLYSRLALGGGSAAIDWEKVFIFVGDERFVPPGDPRSNFGMARRTLLEHVAVPAANVFPMPVDGQDPAEAAAAYGRALAAFFGQLPDSFPPPRFDLVLLGLGDDGHTASLFPGKPALRVDDRWVTQSPAGVLPPPVDRMTLTFPVLNAARHVVFLISGQKKADVVKAIIEGRPDREEYPAAGIRPGEGKLTWLIDEQAASRLAARPG